jgi:hypothetical protein
VDLRQRIEGPRAESDSYLIAMGIDESLSEAMRRATPGWPRVSNKRTTSRRENPPL